MAVVFPSAQKVENLQQPEWSEKHGTSECFSWWVMLALFGFDSSISELLIKQIRQPADHKPISKIKGTINVYNKQ